LTVVGEPAIVGTAHRGGKGRILDGACEQAETGIEKGAVDPVAIHVDDARVRIEPAPAPLGVFEGVGLHDSLPDADGTQAADPARIASILPSTLRRSLPFSSMTNRGRRSRNPGSIYFSHRSTGSRMWPSASTTSYARAIVIPPDWTGVELRIRRT